MPGATRTSPRRRTQRPRTAEQIAVTKQGPRPLPPLERTLAGRQPKTETAILDNGLTVVAVRKASTPMVELRLRIPFGGKGSAHAARAELLAETILLGTGQRTRQQVDAELADVGGHLAAQVNPQRLVLSGSTLATGLEVLLDVLADTVSGAAYRAADVRRERERLVEHLAISAAQPSVIARQHLQFRRFGAHPASIEVPDAADVAEVNPAAVRGLHRRMVLPEGSTLILVGDLRPARVVQAVAQALSEWTGARAASVMDSPPEVSGGPVEAHHRAGAVQSQTRLTTAGVLRDDPEYPAAQLANIVFGGYFSSRLVENLREDKGYTYHAHSMLEFWPGRSAVTISYDTATEATAGALVETLYEMSRVSVLPPAETEIAAARQYAIGSLASSIATQSGYASMLSNLAASGLDGQWLRDHAKRLAAVSTEEIIAAAPRLFSPAGMTGIVVGDLDVVGTALSRLGVAEHTPQ